MYHNSQGMNGNFRDLSIETQAKLRKNCFNSYIYKYRITWNNKISILEVIT